MLFIMAWLFLGSSSRWAPFFPALVGGLTGGSFAILAQIVANFLHRQRERSSQRRSLEGTLNAIEAELQVFKTQYLDVLKKRVDPLNRKWIRRKLTKTNGEQCAR
jgi:hypothetical protein